VMYRRFFSSLPSNSRLLEQMKAPLAEGVWVRRGIMKKDVCDLLDKCVKQGDMHDQVYEVARYVRNKDKSLAFFCAWHAAQAGHVKSAFLLSELFKSDDTSEEEDLKVGEEEKREAKEVVNEIKDQARANSRKKMLIEISDIKRRVSADGLAVKLSPSEKPRVDPDEALRWMRRASDNGDQEAMVALANHLLQESEKVTPAIIEQAIGLYIKAADSAKEDLQGNQIELSDATIIRRDALYNLGMVYFNGVEEAGFKANKMESLKWFHQAHEAGEMSASYLLGDIYRVGCPEAGIKVDGSTSLRLLHAACDKDHPAAAYYLGMLYLEGDSSAGIIREEQKGKRLLERAASLNDPDALLYFAQEAYNQRKYDEAMNYFRQAGNAGSANGWCNLGAMLYSGVPGIPSNLEAAFRAYEAAVELHSPAAMRNLASMLAKGEGTPVDLKHAHYLLNFAKKLEE
jgi:TPR repeat protein